MVINDLLLLFLNITAALTIRTVESATQNLTLTPIIERPSEMPVVQRRQCSSSLVSLTLEASI